MSPSKLLPSRVQELAYKYKVRDAMTKKIISVEPGDSIKYVGYTLKEKRISGLPVEENGELAGIISIDNFIDSILTGRINSTVMEHMTTEVKVLYIDEPLIHAIHKFEKYGYGRFPVLDRPNGKMVGILTKGDIITCLLSKMEINLQEEELSRYRASHLFADLSSNRTTLILRHRVPGGNYKVAGEQSGFLKVNLLRLGISPPFARRIVVASCEAEMNIIIFTDGGELTAFVEEDKIIIDAVDNGPGIPDIDKAMKPGYSTAPDWVREMGFGAGMGLPNMKNCSDEISIHSETGKGTKVEMVFFMN